MVEFLSDDKIAECKEIFDLFDKDSDETISLKELEDVVRALGMNPSLEDLQMMIKQMDKEETGSIGFSEFLQLFVKIRDPDIEDDIAEGFKIFDKDGNGMISVKEFKYVLTTLGDKLREEEIDEFLNQGDVDSEGYINRESFLKLMLNKVDDIQK
jgi:calmodulin